MGHNFEGFLDGVGARQLDLISSVLNKQGFSGGTVMIETIGKAGDNYAADVRRIIAQRDGESFKMVAKVAPTVEQIREAMFAVSMFHNEHVMYTEVLPKFTELEEQAGIPESERLVYATCFGTCLEEPNEIILLEDLQVKGYTMFDRFKPLSDDAVKHILKNFAKLHSYSFVLRNQEPETFTAFTEKLISVWELFGQGNEMNLMFHKLENDILDVLDDEKLKKPLRGQVCRLINTYKEVTKSKGSSYSVIQHGDGWTNNVMFKLQDESIESCCMIDYQMSRVTSPAFDLGYMIYNCTDYAARKQNYHEWIDFYYRQLDRSLAHFGLTAKFLYSKDCLETDIKDYAKLTLAQSAFSTSNLVKQSGEAAKFKEAMAASNGDLEKVLEVAKISGTSSGTINLFKEKIEGIINSHIDFGLI